MTPWPWFQLVMDSLFYHPSIVVLGVSSGIVRGSWNMIFVVNHLSSEHGVSFFFATSDRNPSCGGETWRCCRPGRWSVFLVIISLTFYDLVNNFRFSVTRVLYVMMGSVITPRKPWIWPGTNAGTSAITCRRRLLSSWLRHVEAQLERSIWMLLCVSQIGTVTFYRPSFPNAFLAISSHSAPGHYCTVYLNRLSL